MVVVTLADGEIDALTAILLPALGTYDGRVVLVTEPAISCTVHCYIIHRLHTATTNSNKATRLQVIRNTVANK